MSLLNSCLMKKIMKSGRSAGMNKTFTLVTLFLIFTASSAMLITVAYAQETTSQSATPTHVQVGIWLINIQKIDLSASSYRLDFYLWFSFNPSQISADIVKQFEFVNGQPTIKQIDSNDSYLEYRVTGDFIKTFDFSMYPFETHALTVELEHTTLSSDQLTYDIDPASYMESAANVAGWNLGISKPKLQLTHMAIKHSAVQSLPLASADQQFLVLSKVFYPSLS